MMTDKTQSKVAMVKGEPPLDEAAVRAMVTQAVQDVCDLEQLVKPGDKVVIKPNLFAPLPAPATTDPRVVAGMVELVKTRNPGRLVVADSRSVSTFKFREPHNTTKDIFEVTGIGPAARKAGAELIALEDDELCEVDAPEAKILRRCPLPRTIVEADVLINLPVMKSHSLCLVTLGIKNLHGLLPDEYKIYAHRDELPQKLAEILYLKRPALTLIDGLKGLEGDHSEAGNPVEMNLLIASTNTVAADAVCSAVMGLDPMEVDTTRIAHTLGLGTGNIDDITIVGSAIKDVRKKFQRPDLRILGCFPELEIYAGGSCKACHYYIRRGLDSLRRKGELTPDNGFTLIFGVEPKIPEELSGKIAIAGDCALASESVKRLRDKLFLKNEGQLIYGCPPMEFRLRISQILRQPRSRKR